MGRPLRGRLMISLVASAVGVASCVLGQLSRAEAERIALQQSGPGERVLSANMATIGQVGGAMDGRDLDPARKVWAVEVTGHFAVSCPYTPQGTSCPADETSALVVLDAESGDLLYMKVPAR